MIEYVVPIGVTARRGDVELGLTWLIVGDDWMVLDYATRAVPIYGHAALIDDRGRAYTPMGSGGGDQHGIVRYHSRFREPLDPAAKELHVVIEQHGGGVVLETRVPVAERVSTRTLDAEFLPAPRPPGTAVVLCMRCGRPGRHVCTRCAAEGMALAERRSGRLIPDRIIPFPAELDEVAGVRQSFGGLLAWENTFSMRFVSEPAVGSRRRLDDPPRPLAGRWTARDAAGREFVSGGGSRGISRSDRDLGDAEIEFMPELDFGASPLSVRNETYDGALVAELELPITPAS